ncbi:MAG: FtsX-like permease family protein, partial [Ruminococcus sp.]|nr:FtsX-like permease family protein [Ruminococcus sp.]
MSGTFYSKLAFDNIRKNSKSYFPYIITCIFTVAMYYIMKSLSLNKGLNDAFGGGVAGSILTLGSNVIAFFAFIFLFYTNSFLTKKRKKEFGIYNILGMEKRHIARVIGYESLYVVLISFVGGLGVGILFDKLMYVAISRLMKVNFTLGFYISTGSIYSTLI